LADLEVSGKMPGYYDLIVAATATQVATFNKKHFDSIRGLTVIEPA
jgi:predicted nucleic acid-binding protein